MGATTPVAFDPKPRFLGEVITATATSEVLSGQIVGYADAGASREVVPHTSSLGTPIGVALHTAAAGAPVAIAGNGSEIKVMLDATDSAATHGDWIGSGTVAGCGVIFNADLAAHDTDGEVSVGISPIGVAVEDVTAGSGTAGGTVYILVNITPIWTAAS